MSAPPNALALPAELSILSATELSGVILGVVAAGQDLILDLSAVVELDTAGLQILLLARREVRALGRRFELTEIPNSILDVLHCIGLDAQLELRPLSATSGRDDR